MEKNLSSTNSQHQGSHVVLVVDDDPDILEALSEILEAEGFEIRRARNGKEALERLEPDPPQLILLDLMMPVMDGWEFAQRMRQRPSVAGIPLIVLSADRNVGSKATDIGAVGHLAKPFELSVSTRALFRSNIAEEGLLGGFELGVPMFFRLDERFRLDVAAYLPFSVSGRPIGALGVTRAGLRAPMSLYYQFHPNFLVALGTGLNARELGNVAGTFSVPVSLNVGFNTNINGFWLDVFPYVALPAFYSQAGVNMKTVAVGLFVDVARRL